jgi:hypothetical protein
METERTHHLLICVVGTSLMNKNISTIKINIIAFLDADKSVALKGNAEKIKCMLSHQPNAREIKA